MRHGAFELLLAAGITETHDLTFVKGQRIRAHRLARPWAGIVDAVFQPKIAHGLSSLKLVPSTVRKLALSCP